MSTQETKLAEIANAIRQKEGSTAPISANDFASRILALPSGGVPEGIYTVTLETSDPEGGSVSGGGLASKGMVITVEATVGDSYKFSGWFDGEKMVSENLQYTFAVTGDRHLTGKVESKVFSWKTAALTGDYGITKLAFGNGVFVAITGYSNVALYSYDAKTWSQATLPQSAYWSDIIFAGGYFVSCAQNTNKIAYSSNGITWTSKTLTATRAWDFLTFVNGSFYVFDSSNYAMNTAATPSGTWSNSNASKALTGCQDITVGASPAIATYNGSSIYLFTGSDVSTIGIGGHAWATCCYNFGKYFILSSDGFVCFVDSNSVTQNTSWITEKLPFEFAAFEATAGNSMIMATSKDYVAFTYNGVTWAREKYPSVGSSPEIAYGNGIFVIANGKNIAYTEG